MRERDFPARSSDPVTSQEAAGQLDLNRLEQATLEALRRSACGLTTHEIAEETGRERDSISPRMKRLVKAGLVCDSGEKRIPQGRTRRAIVWQAVQEKPKPQGFHDGTLFGDTDGHPPGYYD